MATTVTRHCAASPEQAWAAVTDFAAHADAIAWTRMDLDPGEPGVGWQFVARSGPGGLLVDSMVITAWDAPRSARIVKLGPVLVGWAHLQVEADGQGCLVTWSEQIDLANGIGSRWGRGLSDRLTSAMVGRALDALLDGLLANRGSTDPAAGQ